MQDKQVFLTDESGYVSPKLTVDVLPFQDVITTSGETGEGSHDPMDWWNNN